MSWIMWIVKNPVMGACVAVIIALVGLTGYLGVQSYTLNSEKASLSLAKAGLETENARLNLEKAVLSKSVSNLNVEVNMAKQAQSALEDTLNQIISQNIDEAKRLKEIENAPASDDGPVAPVLRHALDGLRR